MAIYNNKDQITLEQILEEGWLDRFKAKGAEALGNIKGKGQQALGGIQKAAGDAWQSDYLTSKGEQNVRSGMASGQNTKIEYLKKNIEKRIEKLVSDINNDVQKLGLNMGKVKFASDINNALDQLKQSVDAPTPPPLPSQQSSSTPPPLPKSTTPPPLPTNKEEQTPEELPEELPKKQTSPFFMGKAARKRYEKEQARKRSLAAKKAAATRKTKAVENPKKGKPRDITKTYSKELTRESLEKYFWD